MQYLSLGLRQGPLYPSEIRLALSESDKDEVDKGDD